MYFCYFVKYLLLEKGVALHKIMDKFESPLAKDALCQVWLKLVQLFLRFTEEDEKYENFTDDRRTDWRRKTSDQKSSLEL